VPLINEYGRANIPCLSKIYLFEGV
jgi:hypothetical protein